jgi:fumarate reductase subunit C
MARPYPRQQSNTWYLTRWPYRVFMLREWSSLFLGVYVVLLLVLVSKVHAGPEAYRDYLSTLQSPGLIGFHAVALAFALLHSVTWFQAVPKGLPLRRGERRVPPLLLIGANYAAMAVVTLVVLVVALNCSRRAASSRRSSRRRSSS